MTLLLLYAATFRPACWLVARGVVTYKAVHTVYRPVIYGRARSPLWVTDLLWDLLVAFDPEVDSVMDRMDLWELKSTLL